MTSEELRKRCLSRPGAYEDFPFGEETSVFKAGGKLFAIANLNALPLEVSLKCEPELAETLRGHEDIRPGYHLNKRHWNTVRVDGSLSDEELGALIVDSYDLVVAGLPKAERERLSEKLPRT